MFNIRKIGGMYWISVGRVRIAFCVIKPKPVSLPNAAQLQPVRITIQS
jgi:hypothetical protein